MAPHLERGIRVVLKDRPRWVVAGADILIGKTIDSAGGPGGGKIEYSVFHSAWSKDGNAAAAIISPRDNIASIVNAGLRQIHETFEKQSIKDLDGYS